MDLREQIIYYRALASRYRALNHQLRLRYQILYASPLQDYKKGFADVANKIYSTRWEQVNQSLQQLHDEVKRGYAEMERRNLESIDIEAIKAKYQAAYDEIVEY